MNLVNRRNILKATGVAAATPFAAMLFGNEASAQHYSASTSSRVRLKKSYKPFNKDLVDFASEGIYKTYAKHSQGTASADDLDNGGKMLHFLGKHISDTGTDDVIALYAQGQELKNALANFDAPSYFTKKGQRVYQVLHKYNPTVTLDQVTEQELPTAEVISLHRNLLIQNGYSHYFHTRAKLLRRDANKMRQSGSVTNAKLKRNGHWGNGQMIQANFEYLHGTTSGSAHLKEASIKSFCKKVACSALESPSAREKIAGMITDVIADIIDAVAGTATCAADGIVGAAIDVASDGIGLFLTPIEIALCDEATHVGATLIDYIGGKAVSAIIDQILESLGHKYCGGE